MIIKLKNVNCIVVPKAERDISLLYRATGKGLIAIVWTAKGLLRLEDIAASESVEAIALGTADLALSLGGSRGRTRITLMLEPS
ncbi:MAG: aldolase/citrate lyase family protein [Thermoprotei archaeon]|nr:aldolase/citrate lyase family protein [Thermoprotei archaeon]